MSRLDEIIKLIPKIKSSDKALIEKAYLFAQRAHEGQKRKSGEPYSIHVFETAKNLASYKMDIASIVAGLLHDVLEDTDTSEEELEKEFGKEIVTLVNGVTKLGKFKYSGHERHVESLRKFFLAVADDIRILIIKLADRLHNVETLQYVAPDKQKRIALETIEIHARLANRIGMGKLKGKLEDAAFPFAYPKEYAEVEKLLESKSESNEKELSLFTNELRKELINQKIHIIEISQRSKHKYSLWLKLKRHNMDIDKIYDIVALRVIVDDIENCYRVLGIVHGKWKPVPGRVKDYIANKKPNGYQSLHTTVFTGNGGTVEIQIRTPQMHAEAAYGIASHFAYKENKKKKFFSENNLNLVKQLTEITESKEEPIKLVEDLKMDLFRDRIFVFTPKGDVVDLPDESSPIDFAYAIHSDIGDHVQGVKINGKLTPLHTKLRNNDIVNIITNKNAHPTSKWLEFTKTTMAKKHINNYLKENSLLKKFLSFGKN
ncbi:MAG: RelA/SpoT family protein [Candidatus Pacebacteria bacterium]|nr:RelA/SpoT family protein [Candidatus Paceibacterota bacterium]